MAGTQMVREYTARPTLFSTRGVAPREQLGLWKAVIERSSINCDFEQLSGPGFDLDVATWVLPDLVIVNLQGSPFRVSRDSARAFNGDDGLNLSIVRGGRLHSRRGSTELTNDVGDAMFWSNDQVVETTFPDGGVHQNISLSRRLLEVMVPDLDRLLMTAIPSQTPALSLLSTYVTTLLDTRNVISRELRDASANHIRDLAALALGASRDAREIALGRGVRAARLIAIKRDIEAHLASSDLNLESVARRHGISSRYVRALFDSEGTSFTDYVLKRRLLQVYRALRDPQSGDRKVSAIAFEAGFGDLSYFNKAFRRQFGDVPTEVRGRGKLD